MGIQWEEVGRNSWRGYSRPSNSIVQMFQKTKEFNVHESELHFTLV